MKIKRLIIPLLLILSLCVSSCGKPLTVKAEELSSSYKRTAAETGSVTAAFKQAYSAFSFHLFAETLRENSNSNKLVSPLSAAVCLGLTANGADGETKEEMETVLGLPIEDLNPALYAYTSGLMCRQEAYTELANSVWFRNSDDQLHVEESFLQTLADWYAAEAYSAPFDETTQADLDNWVSKHTDGMIPKMLDEPIDPNTMMFLVNALVFDAEWESAYENSQVREWKFTDGSGAQSRVQGLFSEEELFLEGSGMKGFAKPYKNSGYYFVGLLPEDQNESLKNLSGRLTGGVWLELWENRSHQTVKAMIPEFKTEDKTDLSDVLTALGMKKMFGPEAEFLPMASYAGDSLYVSGVIQKTYLELDRHGTKAAAATGVTMAAKGIAPVNVKEIYLDRPFLYMIIDAGSGLPLFIGAAETM